MTSSKPHLDHLETTFLQLAFALKLWHYVEEEKLPRAAFDIDLIIDYNRAAPYPMRAGQFRHKNALRNVAANNIWINFGSTAVTLWEAIHESTGRESAALEPAKSEADMVAGLSYAIRCCFAHGSAQPKWHLTKKYRIEYPLSGRRVIDLRQANGQGFKVEDVGGFDILKLLRIRASKLGIL